MMGFSLLCPLRFLPGARTTHFRNIPASKRRAEGEFQRPWGQSRCRRGQARLRGRGSQQRPRGWPVTRSPGVPAAAGRRGLEGPAAQTGRSWVPSKWPVLPASCR